VERQGKWTDGERGKVGNGVGGGGGDGEGGRGVELGGGRKGGDGKENGVLWVKKEEVKGFGEGYE